MPTSLPYYAHQATCKAHGTIRGSMSMPIKFATCPACNERCVATVIGRASKHAEWCLETREQRIREQVCRAARAAHGRRTPGAAAPDRPARDAESCLKAPPAADCNARYAAGGDGAGVVVPVRGSVTLDDETLERIACVFLLDVAAGRRTLAPVTLDAMRRAARSKLEVNRRRQWGAPDADGLVEHVRKHGES